MTFAYKQRYILTLLCLAVLLLTSCGSSSKTLVASATPSPYRPFLALQVCLDNTGSYPVNYREAAQKAIADHIDSMIELNTGGMAVFVTVIAKSSFQNEVLSFSIPALPALPTQAKNSDPYKNAQQASEYKKKLQTALDQLATVKEQTKQHTDALRNLRLTIGPEGTDIPGCLANASQHFDHISGKKILLIVSDLQSNVNTQYANSLDLHDVVVKVIYRTCQIVAACQRNDAEWSNTLKRFGATSVAFFDPAESQALQIAL